LGSPLMGRGAYCRGHAGPLWEALAASVPGGPQGRTRHRRLGLPLSPRTRALPARSCGSGWTQDVTGVGCWSEGCDLNPGDQQLLPGGQCCFVLVERPVWPYVCGAGVACGQHVLAGCMPPPPRSTVAARSQGSLGGTQIHLPRPPAFLPLLDHPRSLLYKVQRRRLDRQRRHQLLAKLPQRLRKPVLNVVGCWGLGGGGQGGA
jgi:hypothetical protein